MDFVFRATQMTTQKPAAPGGEGNIDLLRIEGRLRQIEDLRAGIEREMDQEGERGKGHADTPLDQITDPVAWAEEAQSIREDIGGRIKILVHRLDLLEREKEKRE